MSHTQVKLSWILQLPWEPLLINLDELLYTIEKLIRVKERHIDVIRRIKELPKMKICFECLSFTSLRILNDVQTLVARDTVMERSRSDWNRHGAIWNNLRFLPSFIFGPIDCEHVISVCPTKNEILGLVRLDLLNCSLCNFNVLCVKGSKHFCLFQVNCSFGLNRSESSCTIRDSSKKSFSKHFIFNFNRYVFGLKMKKQSNFLPD